MMHPEDDAGIGVQGGRQTLASLAAYMGAGASGAGDSVVFCGGTPLFGDVYHESVSLEMRDVIASSRVIHLRYNRSGAGH